MQPESHGASPPVTNAFPRGSELDEFPQLTCWWFFQLLRTRIDIAQRMFDQGLTLEADDIWGLEAFHHMSIILLASVAENLAMELSAEDAELIRTLSRRRDIIVHEVGRARIQPLDETFFRSIGVNWLSAGLLRHPLTDDQTKTAEENVIDEGVEPVTLPAPRCEIWRGHFERIVALLRDGLQQGGQHFRHCEPCSKPEAILSKFKRRDCGLFGVCRTRRRDFRYPCGSDPLLHRKQDRPRAIVRCPEEHHNVMPATAGGTG